MTMPASRRTRDLRLSVTSRIGNSLTVTTPSQVAGGAAATRTVPVFHNWSLGDPDSIRDPSGTPLAVAAFVGTQWISDGAGYGAYSILQVDVYTRIGPQGDASGDAFGLMNAEICDAVIEPFAGVFADGSLKAFVKVLDFSVPSTPVEASPSAALVCQTPAGGFGVPMERRNLGRRGGFLRETMRLSFRTTDDAIIGRGAADYVPGP